MTALTARVIARSVAVERGGRRLIERLDLNLIGGTVLAVVGPSGCGKSSLLAVLAGWLPPASGQVAISPERPAAVALLPQELGLAAPDSALTNAASGALPRRPFWRYPFGPTTADRLEARALLEQLGIANKAELPVRGLSGGERQRCAVARTLLARPPVLLFDEPVSQLDDANAHTTLALIREQARRLGTVVVTALHQRHLVNGFADQVLEAFPSDPTWRLSTVGDDPWS